MLNPVFRKDMRVLFRNAKVYIGLTIYLVILTLLSSVVLKMNSVVGYSGFNPEYIVGDYLGMLGFQMLAITFVVPAFTSSSISGERERQTLDFMLITRMKTWDIVVGKLMSSLLLVCLMIVASMPIYAIIFYYGGISIFEFISNTIFLIVYATFIGSIAVMFSTLFKKTAAATAMSNLFVLGLSIGTAILASVVVGFVRYNFETELARILVGVVGIAIISLNPVVSFVSIVDTQMGSSNVWDLVGEALDIDFNPPFLQAWHIVAVLYIILSFFMLKIAAKNIIPVKRVRGIKNRVAVAVVPSIAEKQTEATENTAEEISNTDKE
jgi:ABC-type transport system involved in multi-copper enzyme maturation permease subunit